MTLNEAREAIYAQWASEWGTTTRYGLASEYFNPNAAATSWARVTVRQVGGGQSTLGPENGRKYTRDAVITVQIGTPVTASEADGDTLARAAQLVFESERLDADLWCFDSVVRERGFDGKWNLYDVETPCQYEETK
jgi:hypothetical protein